MLGCRGLFADVYMIAELNSTFRSTTVIVLAPPSSPFNSGTKLFASAVQVLQYTLGPSSKR
jgi:hypothetical protein